MEGVRVRFGVRVRVRVSLGSIFVDIRTVFVHIRRVFVYICRIRVRLKVMEWFRI